MRIAVESMTTAEKLDAMEQLWVSLRSSPGYTPPDWHGEILAESSRKIESGEATFSPLDDVISRINQSRK
ncbi:MAG TPA: addiction module antitoxin RelB [Planctomycetaceae bacterium]|nr:addiction module antitoxin RelB [Planctomycetaceae bacterium]